MKFEIDVENIHTGKVHTETYIKNIEDPEVWAKETILNFNKTIKMGETLRRLKAVRVIDKDAMEPVKPSKHVSDEEEDDETWQDLSDDDEDEEDDDPWTPQHDDEEEDD